MRLFSTRYNSSAFNFAMLILRLVFGILIVHAGYQKLTGFSQMENNFTNFMGLGSKISLCLIIFAEFFCGILVILGLFTRLACIPLLIGMGVAFYVVTHSTDDIFGHGSAALTYFSAFLAISLVGPGKISVDGMISK